MSVGNADHDFSSKEELIQGFYDRAQVDHAAAARPVLDGTADLTARIVGVVEAWLDDALVLPARFGRRSSTGTPPS